MNVKEFWDAVLRQDANAIRKYFHPDAWISFYKDAKGNDIVFDGGIFEMENTL